MLQVLAFNLGSTGCTWEVSVSISFSVNRGKNRYAVNVRVNNEYNTFFSYTNVLWVVAFILVITMFRNNVKNNTNF